MASDIEATLVADFLADTAERVEIIRSHVEYLTQQDAPHVSGQLRNAIRMDTFRQSGGVFRSTIQVGPEAPQGLWTNEGTGEYLGTGRIPHNPADGPLSFFWLKVGRHVVFASVAGQPGQHWWDGPSGGREDERLDEAIRAAYGG